MSSQRRPFRTAFVNTTFSVPDTGCIGVLDTLRLPDLMLAAVEEALAGGQLSMYGSGRAAPHLEDFMEMLPRWP